MPRRARTEPAAPAGGGFTLIELLVSLLLGSIVIAMTLSVYGRLSGGFGAQQQVSDAQETLRTTRELIARWLRQAGQNDAAAGSGNRLLMAGGRIHAPAAASATIHPTAPDGSARAWGLGFGFLIDNRDARSDVIDVTYSDIGRIDSTSMGRASFPPLQVTTGSVDQSGHTITVTNPNVGTVGACSGTALDVIGCQLATGRKYALLTNGYHGCLIEITGVNVAARQVRWAAGGGSINAADLSYCAPFARVPAPCSVAGPTPGCWLLDFASFVRRRLYVCGGGSTCADGLAPADPVVRELRMQSAVGYAAPATSVLATGIEDLQVSYAVDAGRSDDAQYGCVPPLLASVYASTFPSDGASELTNWPGGCKDQSRWMRRITLSLLAASELPLLASSGGEAGLQGLNPDWGGVAGGAAGGNYLRRLIRVEVDLRNYADPP